MRLFFYLPTATNWGTYYISNWSQVTPCGEREILINFVSGNDLLPGGTKLLPVPMLTYHQWGLEAFSWGQIHRKCSKYLLLTCVWKISLIFTYYSRIKALQWRHNESWSTVCPGAEENIKAPRQLPLWGGSTGCRWIPFTKGQWCGTCFHLMTSSWDHAAMAVHCRVSMDYRIHTVYYVRIHYNDAIMGVMASQITSLTIVYSTVYSGADQRKYHSSASLAFVRGSVNSRHKWPVTRTIFPFDDVIMSLMHW